jgi:ATP-binding cassette, subfamily B, bacterial
MKVLLTLQRMVVLSWNTDRRRLLVAASLLLGSAACPPLVAVFARAIIDSLGTATSSFVVLCAVGFVLALIGQLMLGHFAHLWYFELGELNEVVLNRALLSSLAAHGNLDDVESAAVANAVELSREDIAKMRATVEACLILGVTALQIVIGAALMFGVAPYLALLPLAAAVPVFTGSRAERAIQNAREKAVVSLRRLRHVRALATSPESQKELRLGDGSSYILATHDRAQHGIYRDLRSGFGPYLAHRLAGQLFFALAYIAAVALAFALAAGGAATAGDILLVVTIASQVSSQVATGLMQLSKVHAAAAGFERLDSVGVDVHHIGTAPAPADATVVAPLVDGIRLESVRYSYPGAQRAALNGLDLHVPAGTSVAIVGENGAGKSTLVKVLHGLYAPTSGRVLVDGVPLGELPAQQWFASSAALFQDFEHFEFTARESIGVGHIESIDDADAVAAATKRAGSDALLESIGGQEHLLGRAYGDGAQLSGGQWQSIAFSRALMGESPRLLSLDEPGHSLDPDAELRTYEAYEAAAGELAARVGSVTFYVTHRLSTVKSADMVLVLRDGLIESYGSHAELIAAKGYYADLFALQARAYLEE